MAFLPEAMGALGTSVETFSSQKATDLSRSFAVQAFNHPASAARRASNSLLLGVTLRCRDPILPPPLAMAFFLIRARVYHFSRRGWWIRRKSGGDLQNRLRNQRCGGLVDAEAELEAGDE